jgi:hypothetical protein
MKILSCEMNRINTIKGRIDMSWNTWNFIYIYKGKRTSSQYFKIVGTNLKIPLNRKLQPIFFLLHELLVLLLVEEASLNLNQLGFRNLFSYYV